MFANNNNNLSVAYTVLEGIKCLYYYQRGAAIKS